MHRASQNEDNCTVQSCPPSTVQTTDDLHLAFLSASCRRKRRDKSPDPRFLTQMSRGILDGVADDSSPHSTLPFSVPHRAIATNDVHQSSAPTPKRRRDKQKRAHSSHRIFSSPLIPGFARFLLRSRRRKRSDPHATRTVQSEKVRRIGATNGGEKSGVDVKWKRQEPAGILSWNRGWTTSSWDLSRAPIFSVVLSRKMPGIKGDQEEKAARCVKEWGKRKGLVARATKQPNSTFPRFQEETMDGDSAMGWMVCAVRKEVRFFGRILAPCEENLLEELRFRTVQKGVEKI